MMSMNFFIKTFGCQMNKNDSAIIAHILNTHGYKPASALSAADIVLVNTCSVREHAEQRALGFLLNLKKWRITDGKVLGVIGCMAQRMAKRISTEIPFVDIIAGPDNYRDVPDMIERVVTQDTRVVDIKQADEVYAGIYPKRQGVTDYVSIMRGCNNFCTYCVVPYVRGSVRSRSPDDIEVEVRQLITQGVKDITLLGQNVNEYECKETNFAKLLEHLSRQNGVCRLRFLTSHPKDLSVDIIKAVQENEALCEWFHLPLQSGSDRILHLMNRHYTRDEYTELVNHIRETIPEATITTDVIAGFPTESEKEFNETLSLMEKLRFDDAYLYRYSHRPGTKAAELTSLPESTILKRLRQLISVQSNIAIEKTRAMMGKEYEVLFEAPARHGGSRGKTRGNKDTVVRENIEPGKICTVIIKNVQGRTPIGEIVRSDRSEGIDKSF